MNGLMMAGLLSTFFGVPGCISLRPGRGLVDKSVEKVPLSVEEFASDQRRRIDLFKTVSGKISFRMLSPRESISGGGRLMGRPPDQLYLEIRDILGRSQFEVRLDKSRFQAVYPSKKRILEDNAGGRNFLSRLGLSTNFSDLMFLSLGIVPPSWSLNPKTWNWESGAYEIFTSDASAQRRIRIEGGTKGVMQVEGGGWKMTLAEFETVNGVAFAREMLLQESGRELEIQWEVDPEVQSTLPDSLFVPIAPAGFSREMIGH